MKIMLVESIHAKRIHETTMGLTPSHGLNYLCGLDLHEHVQNIAFGVSEECPFDRSLYGENNLYGLTDDIIKAFEVSGEYGLFEHVFLLDDIGTVAVVFGDYE